MHATAFNALRPGLVMAMATLLFGLALGVSFGVKEEAFKTWIADGVAAHQELHDAKSKDKIWRYVQRAHFHALGISAFSIGLMLVAGLSTLSLRGKRLAALSLGLGNLYPFAWFCMFLLAPSLGRDPAHEALATKFFAFAGSAGLLAGVGLILLHLLMPARNPALIEEYAKS